MESLVFNLYETEENVDLEAVCNMSSCRGWSKIIVSNVK